MFFLHNPLHIGFPLSLPLSVFSVRRSPSPLKHLQFSSPPKSPVCSSYLPWCGFSPFKCTVCSQSSDQFLGCSEWFDINLSVFKGQGRHRVPHVLHHLNSSSSKLYFYLILQFKEIVRLLQRTPIRSTQIHQLTFFHVCFYILYFFFSLLYPFSLYQLFFSFPPHLSILLFSTFPFSLALSTLPLSLWAV